MATNFLKIVSMINFYVKITSAKHLFRYNTKNFVQIDILVSIKGRIFRGVKRVTQSKNNTRQDKQHLVRKRDEDYNCLSRCSGREARFLLRIGRKEGWGGGKSWDAWIIHRDYALWIFLKRRRTNFASWDWEKFTWTRFQRKSLFLSLSLSLSLSQILSSGFVE